MTTYNGSTITTDILYENGTIVVKSGFSTSEMQKDGPCNNSCVIVTSSVHDTVKKVTIDAENDLVPCNFSSDIKSSAIQAVIKSFGQLEDELSPSVGKCGITESTIRLAIIVP